MLGERVAVIGGTGKMGGWFANFFKEHGFKVKIIGHEPKKTETVAKKLKVGFSHSLSTLAAESDIIILATPMEAMSRIIGDLAKRMKPKALLFDIASVKEPIAQALNQAKSQNINILSIHPMFGSDVPSLKGKNVILIPIKTEKEVTDSLLELFQRAGGRTQLMKDCEEHDQMMALTLALPHFLNILFGITLSSHGININDVKKFGGTTFTHQLLLAETVLQENPQLYSEIEMLNKQFYRLLDILTDRVDTLREIVKSKKIKDFKKIFNEASNYLYRDIEFSKARRRFLSSLEAANR